MKRSRFAETQIIGILKEADSGVMTIQDLCRKHGISDATYYKWKSKYGGLGDYFFEMYGQINRIHKLNENT